MKMATLLLWASILLAVPARSPDVCVDSSSSMTSRYGHIVAFNPSKNTVHFIGGKQSLMATTRYFGPINRLNLNQENSWYDVGSINDVGLTRLLNSWTAAMVGNKAYIVSAYTYPSDHGKIYVYDTDGQRWLDTTNLARVPLNLTYGCVTANGTHLFMADGLNSAVFHEPHVYIYDIAANSWSSQLLDESLTNTTDGTGWRSQLCAIVNQQLYMLGGTGSFFASSTSIYRMDLQTLQVELLDATLPEGRSGGVALAYGDLIYLVGSSPLTAEILVFDTRTGNVSVAFTMQEAVSSSAAIISGSKIYRFGGSRSLSSPSPKIEICDLSTMRPSVSPTTGVPTTSPSSTPSSAPTLAPSVAPTAAPSFSPSLAPTNFPSAAPSRVPTSETRAPSVSPSSAPTLSPSAAPSSAPSFSPSSAPTLAPSVAPTAAPSFSPSSGPTNFPTAAPSGAPSVAPSFSPTLAPSASPTAAPSLAPSVSPTRYPTAEIEDAYNSVVAVNFMLSNLSIENVREIVQHPVAVVSDVERLVERGYIVQRNIVLDYRDFWLHIDSINDYPIPLYDSDDSTDSIDDYQLTGVDLGVQTMQLSSEIWCNIVECEYLILKRDDDALSMFVTSELREYFALRSGTNASSESVTLSVAFMDSSSSLLNGNSDDSDDDSSTNFNFLFYISLCVIGVIILCAGYASCFNEGVCLPCPKVPGAGCHTVDDGNYKALVYFALHLFDFLSDINLSIEIWLNPETAVNRLLILVATASVVFVALPYAVNLYHAAHIKKYVEGNECARMHLESSSTLFSLLVVLSGGCYASIALCSSNIFGLRAFSAGLTQHEMKKLRIVRMSSYFLENIPQIAVQILYAYVIGNVNSAVVFAFVASVLSVLSALLNYCVERDRRGGDKMYADQKYVVWYYLVMQLHEDNVGQYSISEDERRAIKINQGRRKALIGGLSELLCVLRQNIEIVRTDLTKYGAVVFVSHTVYVHDLTLTQNSVTIGGASGGQHAELDRAALPQLYLSRLFRGNVAQINELFRTHFGVSQNFFVRQQYELSDVKKGIWMGNQNQNQNDADLEGTSAARRTANTQNALPSELENGTAGAVELSAK